MTEAPLGLNPKPEPAAQIVLPDALLIRQPGWLSAKATAKLAGWLNQCDWQKPSIQLYGRAVPIPRQQIWMGDAHCGYRYSGVWFEPEPWAAPIQFLANQLSQQLNQPFNSVLLNRYANGTEYMGWHQDDEPELGPQPVIASVSIGATRRFDLRHKASGMTLQIPLADGDLLVMAGACQHAWQHALPKQLKVVDVRFNLTFRYIKHPVDN